MSVPSRSNRSETVTNRQRRGTDRPTTPSEGPQPGSGASAATIDATGDDWNASINNRTDGLDPVSSTRPERWASASGTCPRYVRYSVDRSVRTVTSMSNRGSARHSDASWSTTIQYRLGWSVKLTWIVKRG